MNKTIESIVMGLSLVTILGCESSNTDSNYVSCTPNVDESYKINYLYCNNKGGSYQCSEPKNKPETSSFEDYCSCSCIEPSKEPTDKGW